MYKGRIGVWIIVLILCFSVSGLIKWIPTWFDSEEMTAVVDVKNDGGLNEVVSGNKFNGIKVFIKDSDTDIIFSDNQKEIDGYVKYEDYLYSPLVMYVNNDAVENNPSGFIKVGGNSSVYKIDLYTLLNGMLQSKNFEDIGISKKVVGGPITIYIPNKQSSYYDEVIELFYLTLNNGEAVTDEVRSQLKEKVDKIIGKCNQVVDINQSIYEEFDDSSENHKIFIGPEFLFRRGINGSMSNNYTNSYMPIYFIKTIFVYSDIFVKNSDNNDENIGEKFVDLIASKKNFMSQSGWRVRNATFKVSDISDRYLKNPT